MAGLLDTLGISKKIDSVKNSIASVKGAAGGESGQGITRTDGFSPIGLVGKNGQRYSPGFTPNESYNYGIQNVRTIPGLDNFEVSSNATWFGVLLQNHPDYTNTVNTKFNALSTSDRFDLSKSFPNAESEPYSTRDYYLIFNDSSTDYFRHGLHIEGKTPLVSEKNDRETFDGGETGVPFRLANIKPGEGTSYENHDPVMFGFELVIDAVSSPLLNGSVEDFLDQFDRISEVASRKEIISDFKQQFIKLFKTKGTVKYNEPSNPISIPTSKYADSDSQTKLFKAGKKAYMSYYLKKVQGLEFLIESNLPDKKKFIVDYRKDVIKFNFLEDVSLSLGTLAHLYKLLYWSRPNAKNIIPENLLRFNCDIIISEVRNYNRVRKAIKNGDLEILKDNLSRHVYSLKECQFWFDQLGHDSDVDLSGIKVFEDFVVTMDFKYSTKKFERWTPDGQGFGQYIGYNNGAIWKIGNPGSRNTNTDGNAKSVPNFLTKNLNSLNHNGVVPAIVLEGYNIVVNEDVNKGKLSEIVPSLGDNEENQNLDKEPDRKTKRKQAFDEFKDASKVAAKKLAKNLEKSVMTELQQQINIRLRLLNNTLDKIRNSVGLGRMREPTNVYKPYYVNGISNQFFYDVRNNLRDFLGESLGSALGDNAGQMIKGNDHQGLFGGG